MKSNYLMPCFFNCHNIAVFVISKKSEWSMSDFDKFHKELNAAGRSPSVYWNFDEKRYIMSFAGDSAAVKVAVSKVNDGIYNQLRTNLAINHSNFRGK